MKKCFELREGERPALGWDGEDWGGGGQGCLHDCFVTL